MRPRVSDFGSVDPAPASESEDVDELSRILLDENERLYKRMRAVFALRNLNSEDSVRALGQAFEAESALLRHEIAYVMGQMQNSSAMPYLICCLENLDEHVMVRHEAAEALGAIGDPSVRGLLETYSTDSMIEVAESCEVALDLLAECND